MARPRPPQPRSEAHRRNAYRGPSIARRRDAGDGEYASGTGLRLSRRRSSGLPDSRRSGAGRSRPGLDQVLTVGSHDFNAAGAVAMSGRRLCRLGAIHGGLEIDVATHRSRVRKGQDLSGPEAADPILAVNPEVEIGEPSPGGRAGGPAGWSLVVVDHERQRPGFRHSGEELGVVGEARDDAGQSLDFHFAGKTVLDS